MVIHLDTSFLVDLLRESKARPGPATRRLDELVDEPLLASVHVVCELFAGAEQSRKPDVERQKISELCSGFGIVYPDHRFAPMYGRLLAKLERKGERIGVVDLLIATSAMIADATLVTRDVRHFGRIDGLQLISY